MSRETVTLLIVDLKIKCDPLGIPQASDGFYDSFHSMYLSQGESLIISIKLCLVGTNYVGLLEMPYNMLCNFTIVSVVQI